MTISLLDQALELGPIHATQQEADQQRQSLLEQTGLTLIRLTAAEVETALPQSLQKILAALDSPFSPREKGAGGMRESGQEDEAVSPP